MSSLVLMLALGPGQPEPVLDVLKRGEEAFAAGMAERKGGGTGREQFLAAARHYEELRTRGARNALLYRNLGNAWFLADDLPRAILIYRLGLRLAPGDQALRENLARARERVVFVEGSPLGRAPPEVRPAWLPPWGPAWTFGLTAALTLGGWACLTRWFMLRNRRFLAAGLALLALAAVASWALLQQRGRPARPVAVVARDGVLLRRGDDEAFAPRYTTALNRGVEAEVLHESGGWVQVELAGGEVGWVSAAQVVTGEE